MGLTFGGSDKTCFNLSKEIRGVIEKAEGVGYLTAQRQIVVSEVMNQSLLKDGNQHQNGEYILIRDAEGQLGMFDKPLPCFGCGIGWFSLLLGIAFPLMWYYGTILYFGNYYKKDPRERAGLAANAIAALIFTIAVLITVAIILF